jgi:hypothetical protein
LCITTILRPLCTRALVVPRSLSLRLPQHTALEQFPFTDKSLSCITLHDLENAHYDQEPPLNCATSIPLCCTPRSSVGAVLINCNLHQAVEHLRLHDAIQHQSTQELSDSASIAIHSLHHDFNDIHHPNMLGTTHADMDNLATQLSQVSGVVQEQMGIISVESPSSETLSMISKHY